MKHLFKNSNKQGKTQLSTLLMYKEEPEETGFAFQFYKPSNQL